MALSPELEKYYRNLDEMFSTAGWHLIIDEMKKRIYELQANALDSKTWSQVCEMKGEAGALAQFINLEQISDLTREEHETAAAIEEEENADL